MKTIEEILKSEKPVLVRFALDKGCGFCDKYKPIFEAFEKTHPEIECVTFSKENIKSPQSDMEVGFGVANYPTTLAFEGGKLISKETGIKNEQQLLDMFKTLQNITDFELSKGFLHIEGEIIELKKQLMDKELAKLQYQEEMQKRLNKTNEPKVEAPTPLSEVKKPLDLTGFPESPEAPCDGCQ